MDDELDQMKRINIADYAASRGYQVNRAKSSRSALCMDSADGDRIIIGRDDKSGHSVYYSVRDDNDNGTIVDFVQQRDSKNMGQVRQELRPWIGRGSQERPEVQKQPDPAPSSKDRQAQARGLAVCEPVSDRHAYLESRGLETETLEHFKERVFTDQRGNAIFPHYDSQGVSGLEIKNERFTGFSKGGEKGLWVHGPKDPEQIIVCESAIDCMSHYKLHKPEKAMYVSTAGKMSVEAKQNLKSLLDNHPDAEVVAAFDNDPAGRKYGQELAGLAEKEVKNDLPKESKDWNEQLQKEAQQQRQEEAERRREQENEFDGPSL